VIDVRGCRPGGAANGSFHVTTVLLFLLSQRIENTKRFFCFVTRPQQEDAVSEDVRTKRW
jgi:hypothetical protein